MAETFDTEVRVGWTDGSRYFAVKPPLTDEELERLSQTDLRGMIPSVEQIDIGVECSQFRVGCVTPMPEERVTHLADRLGGLVFDMRDGSRLQVDPKLVALQGPKSSPFNPNTDLKM